MPGPVRTSCCVVLPLLVSWLSAQPSTIDPPAAAQSGMPYFANGPDGTVHLSWIDTLPGGVHALRFARWEGTTWTKAETIAEGKNWFVNWADFPALAVLPDGSLYAHWLTRPAEAGKYGYGIRVARRDPATRQWREIHGMSLDQKDDYAGFLSFAPDTPGALYLSPPATSQHHDAGHKKTVRYVSFQADGSVASDQEIDSDACSCCQTSVARTAKGLIAAYRDHLPGEIRDIAVIRQRGKTWTKPEPLHQDGWKINGCPTEGPSIAAHASEVGIAWLTRAGEQPRIHLALSHNAGETFQAPIRIDDGKPLGRPSVVPFDSTSYVAVWLEKTGTAEVDIRVRRIGVDGIIQASTTVARAPGGRAVGLPKLAVSGNQVLVAWRDGRVRAVLFTPGTH